MDETVAAADSAGRHRDRSPRRRSTGGDVPRLEIALADGSRRRVLGRRREFLIGRGLDNDLRVDDPAVSRHHLLLRPRQHGWELVNCSRNGILVDDRPTECHVLTGTATVALGQHPDAPQVVITPLRSSRPATELPVQRRAHATAGSPGTR